MHVVVVFFEVISQKQFNKVVKKLFFLYYAQSSSLWIQVYYSMCRCSIDERFFREKIQKKKHSRLTTTTTNNNDDDLTWLLSRKEEEEEEDHGAF